MKNLIKVVLPFLIISFQAEAGLLDYFKDKLTPKVSNPNNQTMIAGLSFDNSGKDCPTPDQCKIKNADQRIDFAYLERYFPLSRTALKKVTVENLKNLDQDQMEQLYARLSSGPIPNVEFKGNVLRVPGGLMHRVARLLNKPNVSNLPVETMMEAIWGGKVFFKEEGFLLNRITVDKNKKFVVNLIGQLVDLRVDKKMAEKDGSYLFFPAKLYCGQSLMDSRRESVIIDYIYGEDIRENSKLSKYYRPEVDKIAGKDGLMVRDEIRMIHPGLYLGRAYMNRIFVLNFVLHNPTLEAQMEDPKAWGDECWTGTQARGLVD